MHASLRQCDFQYPASTPGKSGASVLDRGRSILRVALSVIATDLCKGFHADHWPKAQEQQAPHMPEEYMSGFS